MFVATKSKGIWKAQLNDDANVGVATSWWMRYRWISIFFDGCMPQVCTSKVSVHNLATTCIMGKIA